MDISKQNCQHEGYFTCIGHAYLSSCSTRLKAASRRELSTAELHAEGNEPPWKWNSHTYFTLVKMQTKTK